MKLQNKTGGTPRKVREQSNISPDGGKLDVPPSPVRRILELAGRGLWEGELREMRGDVPSMKDADSRSPRAHA